MITKLVQEDLHLPDDPVRFAGRSDTGQGDMLSNSERTDG